MNWEHLDFKLKLRRYMLKAGERGAYRGLLFNNFRSVSKPVFDAVIAECLSEGVLTVVEGNRNAPLYFWHEDAIQPLEASRG